MARQFRIVVVRSKMGVALEVDLLEIDLDAFFSYEQVESLRVGGCAEIEDLRDFVPSSYGGSA